MRLDHIGIAVRTLEGGLGFWARALGLEVLGIETVGTEQVKVAFLPVGETRIELLEPTDSASAVGRFLERRGEGIHHVTLAVDDLERVVGRLAAQGVATVGETPRAGAGGARVAFLHPKSTGGVLVELLERPRGGPGGGEIVAGEVVLAYLQSPQEKFWGVLRRLDAAGVVVEGVDLGSFDDWMAQVERREDGIGSPSVLFVPMGRVEKLLLDRPSGHVPSLSQRFEQRTGRTLHAVLGAERA